MQILAPESNIALPEDLKAAIERANANLVISQAQHQNYLNASNSLKLEIQGLTDERGHLEEKIAVIDANLGDKHQELITTTETLKVAKVHINELELQSKEISIKATKAQDKINSDRKALDEEIEIVAKQKADLATRESKLSELKKAHEARVQKLQEAIS